MNQETIDTLLREPGDPGIWRGRARAVVVASDLLAADEAIASMRAHLEKGDVADAMELAESHLAGDRRNETLRVLASRMALTPGFIDRAAPVLAAQKGTRRPPSVQAALYLLACLNQRRQPDLGLVSPLIWTMALRWLFDYCEPEALRAASAVIVQRYPDQRFLKRLFDAAGMVPPRLKGSNFNDRLDAAVQFVRHKRDGSAGLLVCFCGFHGRMGIPLNFIDRWAQGAGFHTLYLRDLSQSHYRRGVSAFGNSREDTYAAIGAIARALGVRHTAIYGSSMGGLMAIRTGLAVGSQRVLCAAGTADVAPRSDGTRLTPEEKIAVTREEAQRLADELRQGVPGRIAYLHGSEHDRDAIIADALEGIPGVDAIALQELNRHNIDFHLVMTGRYDRTFDWLAGRGDDLGLTAT